MSVNPFPRICGLLLLTLVGCSRQAAQTSTTPAIGLSISTLNNPFFVSLRDGAQAEAQAQGLRLITVDAQNDPARQIASVEDLIQKKVAVILLNPTDSDAVANVVRRRRPASRSFPSTVPSTARRSLRTLLRTMSPEAAWRRNF